MTEKQFGAAGRAVETQGKLASLMVDKHEIGGPGDFAGLESADEVLALVAIELGPETATLLAAALARQDGKEPEPFKFDADGYARSVMETGKLDEALEINSRAREALLRVASNRAIVIEQPPPARQSNEAAEGLALFRPMHSKRRN